MTLLEAIMNKEGCTLLEAEAIRDRLKADCDNWAETGDGDDPEAILEAYGLEPDYVDELLDLD